MGLVIANNVSSLTAQHHLARSSRGLAKSIERLSSGLKVNRGADGPATLVISEKQRAQIAGLRKAIENTEKGISLVQTAEGALTEINALLVKIRSLALDSANTGVNDTDALEANQAEIDNAIETIERIASNTQFGIKKLLDGSAGVAGTSTNSNVTFLRASAETIAGTYAVNITTAGERANVDGTTAQTGALAADESLTVNGVSINLTVGMSQTEVIARINEFTGQTGVVADNNGAGGATRLYTTAFGTAAEISVVSNLAASATSSGFGIASQTDTGLNVAGTIDGVAFVGSGNVAHATTGLAEGLYISFAAGTGANAHETITGAAGNVTVVNNSLVFQIGANQAQTADVAIARLLPSSLGIGANGNQFQNLSEVQATSASKSQDTLEIVDIAIDDVTRIRGMLGAFQQNTLESTANNLRATLENTVNAESVIRDTDFAEEIASFTKFQVLSQAGTSVLQSANQISQLVLALLG
jgi:flagellin